MVANQPVLKDQDLKRHQCPGQIFQHDHMHDFKGSISGAQIFILDETIASSQVLHDHGTSVKNINKYRRQNH